MADSKDSGPRSFPGVATDAPTVLAPEPGRPGDGLLGWDDGTPIPAPDTAAARYELRGELARGGLGRIHFAWDRRLGRAVAIKEPLTAGARARFYREALLTARLQHPGIVPIYDAGNDAEGAPYYAMRLLGEGRSLTAAIAAAPGLDERLTLLPHVIAAADAVAYAHSQRIIHRDLKPDNILLGPFGETVVIDWGLAKDLTTAEVPAETAAGPAAAPGAAAGGAAGAQAAAAPGSSSGDTRSSSRLTPLTIVGTTVGTPAYMSPEQIFDGEVDERTDVYSLGTVLLELLAGKRAAIASCLAADSAEELRRVLPPGAPADLVAIARQAVAERPADRYPSARELAADLWRFAAGQLVKAHAYSPAALARRWLARHRWPVGIAASSLLVLALFGALAVRGIIHQRNLAEAARAEAEANNDALTLVHARTSLDRDPTAALAWLKAYRREAAGQDLVRSLMADAAARGAARHVLPFGDRVRALSFARGGELLTAADHAGKIRLFETISGRMLGEWQRPGGCNLLAAIEAPGGGLGVLTAGNDGRLLLLDTASGASRPLTGDHAAGADGGAATGHTAQVNHLLLLKDGNTVLSASRDGSIWRWDLAAGAGRQLARHQGQATGLAVSADQRLAVSAGIDGVIRLLPLDGGEHRSFDTGQPIAALAMPPAAADGDGPLLATAGADHRIRLWQSAADLAAGRSRVVAEHGGIVSALVFSPDGRWLASASRDRQVLLAAVAAAGASPRAIPRTSPRVFTGHTDDIETLRFSPDGRLLASAGLDGTIRLIELESGRQRVLAGTKLMIERLAFTPDGKWLAAGTQDQEVRVFALEGGPHLVLAGHGNDVDVLAFLPGADGKPAALLSAGHDATVRRWNLNQEETAAAPMVFAGHRQSVEHLALLPGGRYAVSGSADQTLRLLDLETGKSEELGRHANAISGLAVAEGGQAVISASLDGTAAVWERGAGGTWQRARELRGHQGAINGLALSPGEEWLATAGADRTVRLWDWRRGVEAAKLEGHDEQVALAAFSPDGRLLAAGSWNGGIRLWPIDGSGQVVGPRHGRQLAGHTERVRALVFSPDGRILASSSIDRTIRLWHLDGNLDGQLDDLAAKVLRGHEASVRHLAFSPDGRLLASSSTDRTARLWDVPSGELRALRRYDGIVTFSAFSADGGWLAVGGWDRLVHLYPLPAAALLPAGGVEATRRELERLTTASADREGRIASRPSGG